MYDNHNDILTEYKSDDGNKRLHMYLQFPQLRSEFYKIDKEEFKNESSIDLRPPGKSFAAQLNALVISITQSLYKTIDQGKI